MHAVIGDSPITQLLPIPLIAEVAAAAFLGLEILAQNGRELDLDQLARTLGAAVHLVTALTTSAPTAPTAADWTQA
jgi:hypothetical protein